VVSLVVDDNGFVRVGLDDRQWDELRIRRIDGGWLCGHRLARAHARHERSGFTRRLDLVLLGEAPRECLIGLHGACSVAELAEQRDESA